MKEPVRLAKETQDNTTSFDILGVLNKYSPYIVLVLIIILMILIIMLVVVLVQHGNANVTMMDSNNYYYHLKDVI